MTKDQQSIFVSSAKDKLDWSATVSINVVMSGRKELSSDYQNALQYYWHDINSDNNKFSNRWEGEGL